MKISFEFSPSAGVVVVLSSSSSMRSRVRVFVTFVDESSEVFDVSEKGFDESTNDDADSKR